ncbi:MAG TPA: type II secretion system F family protein [Planctomycetota bacterium]|nr:type II secretion system F family protein [Planctomycetota bacterium]
MPKKLQRQVRAPSAAPNAAANRPARPTLAPSSKSGGTVRGRVRPKALADFTSQLATLLEAGIPVVRSLRILEGQLPSGPLQRTVAAVTEDVEGGTPLSEALEKYPRTFDNLYTSMIRAGEAGGIQETILERLASFMESTEDIKAKVKGALAYPVVVIFVAVSVVLGVMTFVIPKFKTIFKQLIQDELPAATQRLIAISDFLLENWWLWALGIPLVIITHRFLVGRVPAYRYQRDRLLLRLPLFGPLIKKTIVARFARTFGTLVESGVPHLEALEIVRASVRNKVLEESIDNILGSIREGEGIAPAMAESIIFDDLITNMVDVGEQTGELDRMLTRIADRYEIEVDRTISTVFKVLEPLLIVVLAVFVGFIIYALLAPMLKLMQSMGGSR